MVDTTDMSSTNNSTPSSSSNGDEVTTATAVTAIILSIVVGVVIIVIVFLIVRCYQKTRSQSANIAVAAAAEETVNAPGSTPPSISIAVTNDSSAAAEPIERFLDDMMRDKPMRFTAQDLERFTQNYDQKLGFGGFGVVYKGRFPNGVPVAVKVLKAAMNKRAEEQFMAEVGTIGRTNHINLVKLYGFCFDRSIKALVYEYMENGSLDRFLFDENHRIPWGKLQEIALGTAKGIRYLHEECQQKIVHYDIKPANVLLTTNFNPKVADFGLAKFCDRERSYVTLTGGRGTPGYAAPELWMPIPVTHKCDVYSFGMLLFEILGRRRNLEFLESVESQEFEWFPRWVWQKFEHGEMENIVSACGIEEKDREKAERMCQVALWCVQYQPEARPSMSSVVRMLEGEEEIVPPTNPFQYMTSLSVSPASGTVSENTSTSRGTGTDDSESSSSRPLIRNSA
ncbi:rust resistance kinase Lr10-like isoform X2 [Musa acuminata AAA Group]|uniref:rust resistance kinase Lr10-like isoform X2 n=1 Tax=Musa acuminata AAA Group TaxID=214697 RepID=UPI0031DACED5